MQPDGDFAFAWNDTVFNAHSDLRQFDANTNILGPDVPMSSASPDWRRLGHGYVSANGLDSKFQLGPQLFFPSADTLGNIVGESGSVLQSFTVDHDAALYHADAKVVANQNGTSVFAWATWDPQTGLHQIFARRVRRRRPSARRSFRRQFRHGSLSVRSSTRDQRRRQLRHRLGHAGSRRQWRRTVWPSLHLRRHAGHRRDANQLDHRRLSIRWSRRPRRRGQFHRGLDRGPG